MGKKLDKLIEGYKPIPMRRMYYPRGMKLSEDFVNAFHREYDRLVDEGLNPKNLVDRFGKSLKFHANEPRKYHQLDEEAAERAALEEKHDCSIHHGMSHSKWKSKQKKKSHKKGSTYGMGDAPAGDGGDDD
tara:strand:+ start:1056 stop:1448 length:393 start_codon:yes stop_codon:yes gene_type:complete